MRPFARRRLRTARPFFVFIRERKPCVRLRRRLWGWNVRLEAIGVSRLLCRRERATLESANECHAWRMASSDKTVAARFSCLESLERDAVGCRHFR